MAYDVVRAIHGGNVDGRRLATACVVGKVGEVREVGGWVEPDGWVGATSKQGFRCCRVTSLAGAVIVAMHDETCALLRHVSPRRGCLLVPNVDRLGAVRVRVCARAHVHARSANDGCCRRVLQA